MRESKQNIPVLYRDDLLLVVNKPAGILSIPGESQGRDLVSLADAEHFATSGMHLHPCHRLDRDTSGIMFLAFGKATQKRVMALFAGRETVKIYLCLVNGVVGAAKGTWQTRIDGKDALTQFQVLGHTETYSVLSCKIHTGRTNQIRIHAAAAGHALVGDDKFGERRRFAFPAKRTLLHAWYASLPWQNPAGEQLTLRCDPPEDFNQALLDAGVDLHSLD